MAEQPLLSVVVTSYTTQRLGDILELLDSIKAQTYPQIELTFVAERSRELYEQLKRYGEEKAVPNFRVLFNSGETGLSAARNLAILEAKGDIIAFVDDDVVLFPDWAEEMVKTFDNTSVIGATGPAVPLWEDGRMAWLPEEFYWLVSCTAWTGWDKITEARSAWGMNMSFRSQAFQECGLFDNRHGYHKGAFAEDIEFSFRVKTITGKRILYNPKARVWHRVHRYRLGWRFVAERSFWIGRSRRMLQMVYRREPGSESFLHTERNLLKQIVTNLLPQIFRNFLRSPRVAWRRLSITLLSLLSVTLGYVAGSLSHSIGSDGVGSAYQQERLK